jgi:3-phenylpropionate/trans-cinnamate dioxygenase ferredoxin reductase subunit
MTDVAPGGADPVVIVGAGHAGGACAAALHRGGFAGKILVIGNESHPPYERPPLSKEFLAGKVPPEKLYLKNPDWYKTAGIELRLDASVLEIDKAAKALTLSTGEKIEYGSLVLATGGRPRRLSIPHSPRIHYLRTIEDATTLQRALRPGERLAVIGGGFIGLEVASTARQLGLEVWVLEAASHLMSRTLPTELGDYFAQLHRSQGTQVFANTRTSSIDVDSETIKLSFGSSELTVDHLFVGIGLEPAVELATNAGLETCDGVVVDEQARSSDPSIWAIGDCARFPLPAAGGRSVRFESWQNAQDRAHVAAQSILGKPVTDHPLPWAWTDQLGVNLQIVGAPAKWDKAIWRGHPGTGTATLLLLADNKLVGAATLNNGRSMRILKAIIASKKTVDRQRISDPDYALERL